MPKSIVICHADNKQEIETALMSYSVSYRVPPQSRTKTLLDNLVWESPSINEKAFSVLAEQWNKPVILVAISHDSLYKTILFGSNVENIVKRSYEQLIPMLEQSPGIVPTL